MKKILFAFAALAAMVSCSNDELVELNQQAIAFGDTFVDNATRANDPSYSAKDVEEFKVWGTVKGSGITNPVLLFDEATVTKGEKQYDQAWTCSQTEYWIPNATYEFIGIVDGTKDGVTSVAPADGMPATISYTADGATDLLCEKVTVKTDAAAVPTSGVNSNKVVSFTFNHLLSKAKFSVENTSTAATNYKYKVTNITITNAYASGTYNVASEAWSGQATGSNGAYNQFGAIEVAAGDNNECDTEKLLIPGLEDVAVSFTLELYYVTVDGETVTETLISTVDKTATATVNKDNGGMLAAHAYDFNLSVSVGGQIDFTIAENGVGGWDSTNGDTNLTIQ